MEELTDREQSLLAVVRNERRRWGEIRGYAAERGDAGLSEAMDAASKRYGDRARGSGPPEIDPEWRMLYEAGLRLARARGDDPAWWTLWNQFVMALHGSLKPSMVSADPHVARAEALEDLQHALIVGDETLRLDAERRMRTGMAADLSLGLNLLIEALTEKKNDWEERAWTFVEEMVPGEREHLTGQGKTST